MKNQIFIFLMLFTFCYTLSLNAQQISGKVIDISTKASIPGVNILVKGTSIGTISDFEGEFSLKVDKLPVVLVVSSIGFQSLEIRVDSTQKIIISLQEGQQLDEVILIGNRSKPRTILNSPVPIDNVGVSELKNTGQSTIDKMLTYKIPSFNSTNQTVSDATAHFDPADLRGLGPSRTLVLVNGKRKNQSALVYINDTPGKGEVGVDFKSVPSAAIERIEVLRDGASAQYGSDAIAGVINMVLKKNVEFTTVNTSAGITTEGDGFNFGTDINSAFKIGKNGGYLNFTFSYYNQKKTNRAGTPGGDGLFGFLYNVGAIPVEAADGFLADGTNVATAEQILNGDTDFQKANPNLGMIVGQPEYNKSDVFFNAGIPFKNDSGEFYTFGGISYRKGTSFAVYRTPWWPGIPGQNSPENNPLYNGNDSYQGFQPTFETDIVDNNITVGAKWKMLNLDVDLSGTYGGNSVDYGVENSINTDLGANSPISFEVGGYSFSNILANIDFSRNLGKVNIAFGGELRKEQFKAEAGEPDSYFGSGVQSFPGLQPENAVNATRNNFGLYGDIEWEPSEVFLLSGALRYENFSDFGNNTSWKIAGRYSLGDNGAIRASYSTGFRAPSLHQIYLSNIQTLVSGNTISNQGTFNNVDPIIRQDLGVPQLKAETAKNISAGITFKPVSNLSLSADFYNVKVNDRVLFTGEVGFDGDNTTTNPVEQVLIDNSITSLKFFVNAVNTNTTGFDFVAHYRNIEVGTGKLGVQFSANFNKTEIEGQIETPAILAANNYDIFNRKEQARITSSRPKSKVLLGFNYSINKLHISLNNSHFGEVTWQHAENPDNDQTFSSKIITDLSLGYDFSEKIRLRLFANNLFNIYPDEIDTKGDFITNLGGRFKYPWEVNQFGFSGTIIGGNLSFRF